MITGGKKFKLLTTLPECLEASLSHWLREMLRSSFVFWQALPLQEPPKPKHDVPASTYNSSKSSHCSRVFIAFPLPITRET